MAVLRGIDFADAIAPVVRELFNSLDDLIGDQHWYAVNGGVRYAMKPPTADVIADGVIFRMDATKTGAFLRRGRGTHREPKQANLRTSEDIQAVLDVAKGWYEDVQANWQELKSTRRNPAWTRDELILALDLYFKLPPWTISGRHPAIQELSETLGRLSATDRPDAARYRNPSGTYMKMMNLQYRDPTRDGRGLKGGGQLEAEVWQTFGDHREELSRVAATIRAAIADGSTIAKELNEIGPVDELEEAVEGGILTRLHRLRERNQKIVKAKKSQVMNATGKLACESCSFDFAAAYGELGAGYIECHHVRPLAELTVEGITKLSDLALVCANCHRMLHRRRQWLAVSELRGSLQESYGNR